MTWDLRDERSSFGGEEVIWTLVLCAGLAFLVIVLLAESARGSSSKTNRSMDERPGGSG